MPTGENAEGQRGPAIRALSERPGPRCYWRYDRTEPDESFGQWYFECVRDNDEWWCIRQIGPHPAGVSAYDWQHLKDDRGFLTDQPIEESETLLVAIVADEFEAAWQDAVKQRGAGS